MSPGCDHHSGLHKSECAGGTRVLLPTAPNESFYLLSFASSPFPFFFIFFCACFLVLYVFTWALLFFTWSMMLSSYIHIYVYINIYMYTNSPDLPGNDSWVSRFTTYCFTGLVDMGNGIFCFRTLLSHASIKPIILYYSLFFMVLVDMLEHFWFLTNWIVLRTFIMFIHLILKWNHFKYRWKWVFEPSSNIEMRINKNKKKWAF